MNTQMAFADQIQGWLGKYAERTQKSYRKNLSDFIVFIDNSHFKMLEIGKDEIGAYKEECWSKYKKASVANRISTISSWFDYLETIGAISNNPVRLLDNSDVKVEPYTSTKTIDAVSVKAIIDSISQDPMSGVRDRALLILLFFTGIKASVALGLEMKDIIEKEDGDYLAIPRKDGTSYPLKLDPYVASALEDYLSQDMRLDWNNEDPIFQRTNEKGDSLTSFHGRTKRSVGLTIRALEQNLAHYAKDAGIEGATLRSVHQSSAEHQIKFGKSDDQIMYYMGHSSKSSVRRFIQRRAKAQEMSQIPIEIDHSKKRDE